MNALEIKIAIAKMDKEQFAEWLDRQHHGDIQGSASVKGKSLVVKLASKCFYAIEDAKRELNEIMANGY